MLALTLGLTAALIWAVHDLLARKIAQGAALLPLLLLVLGSGCVVLGVPALFVGGWASLTPAAVSLSAVAGLCFAMAIGALYRAFSMAPARIVSPIIGAYPILSMAIAVMQGRPVTGIDWLAVGAVVLGVAIVSFTDAPGGAGSNPARSHLAAMGWSIVSACAFALTFALGQEAARQGSELPTILITRGVATVAVAGLCLARRASLASLRGRWWLVAAMGAIDAGALSLVTASGSLPHAEYASVSSSLFGVGTILLASHFLDEKLRPVQWLGVATVFGGIAALSLQG